MRIYNIRKPKMSEKLAEFLGICYGDGNLYIDSKRNDYQMNISCHLKNDNIYLKGHVSSLINHLFGLRVYFYERKEKNTLSLYLRSKELVYFLNNLGMPIGRKNHLSIPSKIKNRNNLMASFIRGFADTDGSIHFKKKHKKYNYYPTIDLSSISRELIEQMRTFLIGIGFVIGNTVIAIGNSRRFSNEKDIFRLFIYGNKNLERWMKYIGFNNNKHLSKYTNWGRMSRGWDSNPRPIGLYLSQELPQ